MSAVPGRRAVCALATLAAVGCAAAPQADRPDPRVGDVYEYARPVLTVDCRRWRIEAIDAGGYLVSRCGPYRLYRDARADYNVSRLEDEAGDTVVSFAPYFPDLAFPLHVGKRWSGHYRGFRRDLGVHWESDVECSVEAYEPPPDRTFRIGCEDHWHFAILGATTRSTRWYSPALRSVVRVRSADDPAWDNDLVAWRID